MRHPDRLQYQPEPGNRRQQRLHCRTDRHVERASVDLSALEWTRKRYATVCKLQLWKSRFCTAEAGNQICYDHRVHLRSLHLVHLHGVSGGVRKAFFRSDSVTQIVMRYTPMFLMGSIMFFVQMTLQNVNVGLGQAKEALLLAVNRKVVILIPLCFALTQFLGFKGVYLSEGIADLVAGIVTTIVIFTSFPKIFRRREEEVKQAASN